MCHEGPCGVVSSLKLASKTRVYGRCPGAMSVYDNVEELFLLMQSKARPLTIHYRRSQKIPTTAGPLDVRKDSTRSARPRKSKG